MITINIVNIEDVVHDYILNAVLDEFSPGATWGDADFTLLKLSILKNVVIELNEILDFDDEKSALAVQSTLEAIIKLPEDTYVNFEAAKP